jgi:hypothetical protein
MAFRPSTNADDFDVRGSQHHTSINSDYRESGNLINRKSASFKVDTKEKLYSEKLTPTEALLDQKAKV